MSDGNRWNSLGHWGMGIAAGILPGLHVRWAQREIDQNPQENDEYPRVFVAFQGPLVIDVSMDRQNLAQRLDYRADVTMTAAPPRFRIVAYYGAPRVFDSQRDMLEIAQGSTVGQLVSVALWVAAGFLIARSLT